jgi:hypothetical protein
VGKTALVRAVADELQLRLHYLSASTLDPFADLIGIPVPCSVGNGRGIEYLRPEALDQAQIIFIDEFNRAPSKVTNGCMEIVQFRSLNGEKLPWLRSVFAAINPPGELYHTNELDPALVDKFHIYLSLNMGPQREWFRGRFGPKLGQALVDWYYSDLDTRQQEEVSNRRLEYIGCCHESGIELTFALPPKAKLPIDLLKQRLMEADTVLGIDDFLERTSEFASVVENDLNVACRFAALLPMMRPQQQSQVREICLALPGELLAKLKAEQPFVFKKLLQAVAKFVSPSEGKAFGELLDERLQTHKL